MENPVVGGFFEIEAGVTGDPGDGLRQDAGSASESGRDGRGDLLGARDSASEAGRDGRGDLLGAWGVPDDPALSFELARSAVAAVVTALDPPRVWVPAYICSSVPAQVSPDRLAFYGVGESLTPDLAVLEDSVSPGDVVLAVDYFGCAPAEDFRLFAASRSDVFFVEDRAQAVDTGTAVWGDVVVYSPRKVVGVPDGGLLVPGRSAVPDGVGSHPARPSGSRGHAGGRSLADVALGPMLRRSVDPTGERMDLWHDQYLAIRWPELAASDRPMSLLTRELLALVDPERLGARRRANFAVLADLLQDISFLDMSIEPARTAGGFVPFGFPVRLPPPVRDAVRAALWEERVYAFRHFADLPSPPGTFPVEHVLSRELMTLPCDQRYGSGDMERVAQVVRRALGA